MQTITLQQQLKDAVEGMGGGDDEVSFYNGYSGRGMYGRKCVGITGSFSDCMMVLGELIKEAKEEPGFDDMVDQLLDFKQDSMGRDVILYWPELEDIEEDERVEDDGQPSEQQEWHDFDPDC